MRRFSASGNGGVAVASATPALPVIVAGQQAGLTVDQSGRLLTTTQRRPVQDGPTFVIPAGQTNSQDVDTQAAFPAGASWTMYDDAARLAGETITIQVSSLAAPAAGDWRDFTGGTVSAGVTFGATLNTAVTPTGTIWNCRRMRLKSSAAVGAGGRSFPTTFIS